MFRTELKIEPAGKQIQYGDELLFMGSCFSEQIGKRMINFKFGGLINPFGISYNPISISRSLDHILTDKEFRSVDLLFHNEQWMSLQHHSRYSHKNKHKCLEGINQDLKKGRLMLENCNWLCITLGTAFTFFHKDTEQVVANCHRLPQSAFSKNLLDVEEVRWSLKTVLARVKEHKPDINVLLTVSPIRHWKEGAVANMKSKAILLNAVHQLVEENDHIYYFPAYEIMMDDLRDYRFYKSDMLHPNDTAVEYIFRKFIESYISADCYGAMVGLEKLQKAMNHRPRNPRSKAHLGFLRHQLLFLGQLEEEWPALSFRAERSYFETELYNHQGGDLIA